MIHTYISPWNPLAQDGSIQFLETNCLPNKDHSIQCSVYSKPTNTDWHLDCNSNCPYQLKISVFHALIYRAKNICSMPKILAKEMNYLHQILLNNNYPDWLIKQPEKKPPTPIIKPRNMYGNKEKYLDFCSLCSYFGEKFKGIFHHTNV